MNPMTTGAILGALIVVLTLIILFMTGRLVEQRKVNSLNAVALAHGNQKLSEMQEQLTKSTTPILINLSTEQVVYMADRLARVLAPMLKGTGPDKTDA
jgi:hypothetical protein